MFRFPSFSEAVDAETGDQDGQMFLVVSSGRTELPDRGDIVERANLLLRHNHVRGGPLYRTLRGSLLSAHFMFCDVRPQV
jgi:hypothetical protein